MAVRGVVFALAILSCFQGLLGAPDNRGKEFILAFMDNYLDSFDLELFVTTSRTSTVSVEVTTPKVSTSKKGVNSKFTVTAGKVYKLKIDPDMRLEGTEFSSKGILVKASDEVVVYGVNKQQASNDAYLGLPMDILGTKYYTVTYYPPYRKGQIMVVGTQDKTSVEITISKFKNAKNVVYNKKTYKPGDTISLTMNKYDTFQLQSTGDLTGTLVSSNKPVAVFSGNMKTNTGSGGTQDHLVEQMTPVDTWGKTFATVPTPDRTTGDYFKFVASESSTTIKYTCAEKGKKSSEKSVKLSKAGDFAQVVLKSKHYCYIESNKGIMVVQIVMSQQSSSETADPAMLLIPPIEQYAADYTFTTPEYSMTGSYTNYFMFVVSKKEYNGLRLDGKAFSKATYVDIPKTDLVGGYIKISEGSHTVRHTSPISVFGGFLFGKAHIESYGFSVGMRLAGVNKKCVPSPTKVGDGIDNDCDGKIDEELCTTENKKKDDDGDNRVDEDCATPPPIDGKWGSWGSWASCSVSCKVNSKTSGTQTRTRKCDSPAPKYDGKQCDSTGDTLTRTCKPSNYCPINGGWASWGKWGGCSKTCDSGVRTRTRACSNPKPNYGGKTCDGSATSTIVCTNKAKCNVDGNWGKWSSWSSCSKNCGGGERTRKRSCNNPTPVGNGKKCPGDGVLREKCNTKECVVHGKWSKWGSWSACTPDCGVGKQTRTRKCDDPKPSGGGKNCPSVGTISRVCNNKKVCKVDGKWGAWTSWTSCSKKCGGGERSRKRSCNNPAPAGGGKNCPGDKDIKEKCNTKECVVDGKWGKWSSWGDCTPNCGIGERTRTRKCDSPKPSGGGKNCPSVGTISKVCVNKNVCKVDGKWGSWSTWTSCSKQCGGGERSRKRSCNNPPASGGGKNCPGDSKLKEKCNTKVCVVDGKWGSWSSWSKCSKKCGGGEIKRKRECNNPPVSGGGKPCTGDKEAKQSCNTYRCSGAPDNRGREFIIGFMDNYLDSIDLELFVTTSKTSKVEVEVTSPKWKKNGVNTKFTITAGQVKQIQMKSSMRLEGTELSPKGILVEATDEVTVYGVNKQQASNDVFLGLPTDVLGTEYYTVTYYPPYRKAQLMVIGTQDDTSVKIKLSNNNKAKSVTYNKKTYKPGDTISLKLNRYDAFHLQSSGDLTGSLITSDKPVSAFSGNMKTKTGSGSSQDHLVEQLTPKDTWGKRFATVPTPKRTTGDYFKFVASEDSTDIKCSCVQKNKQSDIKVKLSKTGDFEQIVIKSDQYCYIESSKAILVVQIVMSQQKSSEPADPAMMIIPPIEQYAADYTFTTPTYSKSGGYENFFMFIVKKSQLSGLRLDGKAFSKPVYSDIPNTDLIGGYITVSEGSHSVNHISPIQIFGGYLFGKANVESYGFPIGLRLADVNTICQPTVSKEGDGIDNDCDGLIDEEMCTPENNRKDDDNDGKIDEDCAKPRPLDGAWGKWTPWTSCSISCKVSSKSAGTQTRKRACNNPTAKYGGKACDTKDGAESKACTPTKSCAVDGKWGSWGSWTSCSKKCGGGERSRARLCNQPSPANGGKQCPGGGSLKEKCNTKACVVDGRWGSWGAWSACSKKCGGGDRKRSRNCDNPPASGGGKKCPGDDDMKEKCNTQACKVDGKWGSWGAWSSCSKKCGGGDRKRARKCDNPAASGGGKKCPGNDDMKERCNTQACKVDGKWGSWGAWSSCSKKCGGGERKRARKCDNPAVSGGGKKCPGDDDMKERCNTQTCKVDGKWGAWGAWSSCSKKCGGGDRKRARKCDNPAASGGGKQCSGDDDIKEKCNTKACGVDGKWSSWGSWSKCSKKCGGGEMKRKRECNNPPATGGGTPCPGDKEAKQSCNTNQCSGAPDNRGREFIIGFMDNYLDSIDLELFVTTSKTSKVEVEVTSPKWTKNGVNTKFTITAGQNKQIKMKPSMRLEGTELSPKGILVKASDEVTVYGVNKQPASNDVFLGLPTDILGTEYYTVSYYPPYRKTQLMVIGTQDDTSVRIKLSNNNKAKSVTYNKKTYKPGDTISLKLNSYDAFHLQSSGDLTGSLITSNKPVSAFSGNMKTNTGSGNSQDHLVEQLTPKDTWGKRFATVPTPRRTTGDYFKFIASADSTNIKCSCVQKKKISEIKVKLSKAGDFQQIVIKSDQYCYIESTKAILVVQIVMSQQSSAEPADPAMMIIPPIEQYAADYTFTTPTYSGSGSYENYFMFIVKKSQLSGLRLDGKAFSRPVYSDIPNTDLIGGYISVSEGSHSVKHISPIQIFGGYLFGKANIESYGFPIGLRLADVNSICQPTVSKEGDGIDNDCDGLIDEEMCTPENNRKDDDNDGKVDEDCAKPRPIDGAWATWTSWTSCSISCKVSSKSAGTQTRKRVCNNPKAKYGGKACDAKDGVETKVCKPSQTCTVKVDGKWGAWGTWTACSKKCGGGERKRSRKCDNPPASGGGKICSGDDDMKERCNSQACAVDGNWGKWSSWSTCSPSCGTGRQTRTRKCDAPKPSGGGKGCASIGSVTRICINRTPCLVKVDGKWGAWGTWTSCSKKCGGGERKRERKCNSPAAAGGGKTCPGDDDMKERCNTQTCPVDGKWGSWGRWTACSKACGGGEKTRERSCNNPPASNGGKSCPGSDTDKDRCNSSPCKKVDGKWGKWSSWSACSPNCGTGKQTRTRKCDSPAPSTGGRNCQSVGTITKTCINKNACKVDGNWAGWGAWSHCTKKCGGGDRSRKRSCSNPAPSGGGKLCAGDDTMWDYCNSQSCGSPPDNRGKEFIVAFMDNYLDTFDLELFVTTSETKRVNVEVTSPKWKKPSIREKFTITAGEVKQIKINKDLRLEGTEFSSKALLVKASEEVVIYGVNKQKASNDAFLGLPTDVLGTKYYAVTYYPPTLNTQLLVVGTEDRTQVTIKLADNKDAKDVTYNRKTYRPGDTISLRMDKYDTFQLQGSGDLTGSYITSDRPVSVSSGNKKTKTGSGSSRDHLVEQLTPVDTWGKRFATISTPKRTTGDYFRFIASDSGTRITYTCNNGRSSVKTVALNKAGEFVQVVIAANSYCYIESNKAIMVVQIVMSQQSSAEPADPAMMIIPPIEQYAADYTFTTPTYSGTGGYENFFMFVTKTNEIQGLRLDSKTIPNLKYKNIPKTDLSAGYFTISEGTHTVRHTSSISVFGGFLFGKANVESYGFAVGMRLANVNRRCVPTPTKEGDGIDNDCDGKIDEEICTPENKKRDDDNDGRIDEDCATPAPLDGKWGAWGTWGKCSLTCKSGSKTSGTQTRRRACNNPVPKYKGKMCSGDTTSTQRCTTNTLCPVNGKWANWGSWGSCSKQCGGGEKTRTRACSNPAPVGAGKKCPGSGTIKKLCNSQVCVVNGGWTSWSKWSVCSKKCGGGDKYQKRSCSNPPASGGGRPCSGDKTRKASCNTQICPVDGKWGDWDKWSKCSKSCGGGERTRRRQCNKPSPLNGGKSCSGSDVISEKCNTHKCSVDGKWSSWSSYGPCSVSCGSGKRTKSRKCDNPALAGGGNQCSGSATHSLRCSSSPCPINGGFTAWGRWSGCSKKCGGGERYRKRYCTNPVPSLGGKDCAGDKKETERCNTNQCKVNGGWSSWGSYGACSKTCGVGVKTKKRTCSNPTAAGGGDKCSGKDTSSKACFEKTCSVDGGWGAWSSWKSCSKACGGGERKRKRMCNNPLPTPGGKQCAGDSVDTEACNTQGCKVDGKWTAWSQFSKCSKSCGKGIKTKTRSCSNPPVQNGGKTCVGRTTYNVGCFEKECPVDGQWSSWSPWKKCSKSCGGGQRKRERTCSNPAPAHGGSKCQGDDEQSRSCNSQSCVVKVDGKWNEWSPWAACTVTCGAGSRSRKRLCDDPPAQNGGKQCSGDSEETTTCNQPACPVAGGWSNWAAWEACTAACGTSGTKRRERKCDTPPPRNGGKCQGDDEETTACTGPACPVNGGFSLWGQFDQCSVSCGGGERTRTRTCSNPPKSNGGKDCFGDTTDTDGCNMNPCPVDGDWSNWSAYGPCTAQCGGGTSERTRTCSNPPQQYGGKPCPGSAQESIACNPQPCLVTVDGKWADWSSWGTCSVQCGGGSRKRIRTCSNPSPANGGSDCVGAEEEDDDCNTQGCIVNGQWSDWSTWFTCTAQCGGGTTTRQRTCTNPSPKNGGTSCVGDDSEDRDCNLQSCVVIVDGKWSDWSSWDTCSAGCGGGNKERTRSCTNPAPKNGGSPCSGSDTDETSCNTHVCPVDGGYSPWSLWSSCSVTCGNGQETRTRSCDSPAPANNGKPCSGDARETQTCTKQGCPVDGGLSQWSVWGGCSVTCGTGEETRSRACDSPAPQNNGRGCVGDLSETKSCTQPTCPVDGGYSDWSVWSTCSVSCGNGQETRTRTCDSPRPANNGKPCSGDATESVTCVQPACPVDGGLSQWTAWGPCSVTCGTGIMTKTRECNNPVPSNNGKQCTGDLTATQSCTKQACTGSQGVDGQWATWSAWGVCSKQCGTGTTSRQRTCTNPAPSNGGSSCVGPSVENKDCNTQSCANLAVNGGWSSWSGWGSCTVTCGGGTQSRGRSCTNPSPSHGGSQCSGKTSEFQDCNIADCPQKRAGVYQSMCPTNWFTCDSGSMRCIQMAFKCDCSNDCDDGSDEDSSYAGCTPEQISACKSGVKGLHAIPVFTLILSLLIGVILVL